MQTDRSKYSVDQALAACAAITGHVTSPTNPFNLTAEDLKLVGDAKADLAAKADAQQRAALDLKDRVRAKDASLAETGAALSFVTKIALASSATAAQLSAIGMARPARPVRPLSIPAPSGLAAQGFADGTVRLAWDRGGNRQGTAFAVEWSADGLAWEIVEVTTRASVRLSGYAPGAAAWFRVTARRAGLASLPSGAASVYAPLASAPPALRVA